MTSTAYGANVNLQELRHQLAGRLAEMLAIVGSVLTWLGIIVWAASDGPPPFPTAPLGLFVALATVGWSVRRLIPTRPALARHVLAWGLTAGLLAGMALLPHTWLPFLGLILVFVTSSLVSGGGLVTGAALAVLAGWLTYSGVRAYPLTAFVSTLAMGTVTARLVVRTLYTALEWAWTMQQRADRLLEVARDRQGELANALKSLDVANAMLRRTQRELIAARKQAEEARLMKEQFAANVSHELRTPLNLILGFSEVMCLSSEVYGDMTWPPPLRRDVYRIHQSARHLLKMIDDVLDLSRIDIVGFALNKEPTQLETLLRETVESVEGLFRGRPVHLDVEITGDVPMLELDRTRIRQVLINLLNNAARFTEEGTVRVEAKRENSEVVVSVRDTGAGIPQDKLPHMFQEFYQVDRSLSRRHGGTGLGLAISRHFVEAHDGRIWVNSEQGVGSTFAFSLPIPGEHVPFSHLREDRPLELVPDDTPAPIVVLDPDPAVVALIGRHLETYEVVQVAHADRLPDEVALHHPRAVVCNVRPGQQSDGATALSTPVPVIECSLPSQAWVAQDLAVIACLTKPITTDHLLVELDRLDTAHDVLIVDDDIGFCQLVERLLEASGRDCAVRRAYDGAAGLFELRARRPDVLLLDLIMPGVDGFQVLEEMQQEPELADVPVVLLTATSFVEDALAQRSGQMVVRRPDGLKPGEVLRCLQALIEVLEPHYDERSASDPMLA